MFNILNNICKLKIARGDDDRLFIQIYHSLYFLGQNFKNLIVFGEGNFKLVSQVNNLEKK